jgi:predicted metal-binding membrane protein
LLASSGEQLASREGVAPLFAAARTRLGLIALLFGLAALGWWWTVEQMRGMDDGPWSDLGAGGWFLGVWIVMMAAMMFPSVSPTVALYSRMTRDKSVVQPLLFALGYLATWAAVGALVFTAALVGGRAAGNVLAWDRAGRWVAATTLVVAAVYELTPLKDACLGKCRSPIGLLLGSWRNGPSGAFRMGVRNGAWCVGCCWALMASFFALGIMSAVWMAIVAGIIAIEKTLPWRRVAVYGTAAVLLALGVLLYASPGDIPGLTIPADGMMSPMSQMTP